MPRLITDFSLSEQGHAYRVADARRVVNTFTTDGSGTLTFTPPTSADRVVITNFLASTDTAATIALSGSDSETIPFYFGHKGGASVQMSGDAPIVGEIGESFAVACTFTGIGSGQAMATMFGYTETDDNYSGRQS